MIIYNSRLAKCLLDKKKHSFMILGCYFARYKQLEFWEEMENQIHVRQYMEYFLPALLSAVGVSL